MSLKDKLGNIYNWPLFILAALALRGIVWLYFGHLVNIHLPADQKLYSYFVKDDYIYFFQPVDTFLRTGTFSYWHGQPFTGRMPGYSIVYLLLRLLFSPQGSVYGIVILQYLLSSVSVYILALTGYKIFQNKKVFYVIYGLYVLAVFPGCFDLIIVPESFSVSAFIFCLYYITNYIKDGYKIKHLLLSGIFLTWTIFLREYTGLLIIVFPVAIGIHHLQKKQSLLKAFKAGLVFCIPFIIADAAWTARNYIATGKFIPVASTDVDSYGKLYSASWNAIDELINAWGENGAPFDVNGMAYYYRTLSTNTPYPFPARIFKGVSTYNADSLMSLRKLYANYYYSNDSLVEQRSQKSIITLCALYKQDYINHNPVSYYLVRPAKDLKYLMFFSGTGYLPMPSFSECNPAEKLIKGLFALLYFVVLIGGITGILFFIAKEQRKSIMPWLMIISCASIIGVVVLINPLQEPRYSVHIFTLLVLFSGAVISKTGRQEPA